jgi:hypothetical protein
LAPDVEVDADRFDDIAADSANVIVGAASATIGRLRAPLRVLRAPSRGWAEDPLRRSHADGTAVAWRARQ